MLNEVLTPEILAVESQMAMEAIERASLLIPNQKEKIEIKTKIGPSDLVTRFDNEIELSIRKDLEDSNFRTFGEEGDQSFTPKFGEKFWVIDPIDGTTNFVQGLPFYCHSVGLVSVNEAQGSYDFYCGAVKSIELNQVYFSNGAQSFLNKERILDTSVNTPNIRERSSGEGLGSKEILQVGLFGMCFPVKKYNVQHWASQLEMLDYLNAESRGIIRLGSSALKTCYAASGALDIVFGFDTHIWDVAGGLSIAKTAGRKVITQLVPGTHRLHFICGKPELVDIVDALFIERGLWKRSNQHQNQMG